MTKIIDPYGAELVEDYSKIITDFGLEKFDPSFFPHPNRIMRRGVVFAGRDLQRIADCIKNRKKFYVLSGIMPTADKIHFGTKMVVENIRYFQEQGAKAYILIADLESAAARGVPLEEAKKRAMDFHIPAYLALGLDPKKTTFYFQSENKEVVHLAYECAKKITLNEFKAIYGNADPGRIMSAVTQVADILYPQLEERMPGIIPTGIDQDPHIRLTRDVVARMKEKRFFSPSSVYHKFTPALDGHLKMSKSMPESCIELPEDMKPLTRKLKRALTGGRETEEEQRRIGGVPEKCMIFELYKQHLIENDKDLDHVYAACCGGTLLCGKDKQDTVEHMDKFMSGLTKGIEKAKSKLDSLHFVKF
ncbi:tryptophan--tRNA ligase [Candidatus Woesearchaeota archaeon]|nr:tryptophan--tRNA ligase [Candidatus Woesearchaeota archaeon]